MAADWPLHQRLSRIPDVVQWTLYPPDLTDEDAQQFASRIQQLAEEGKRRAYGVFAEGEVLGMVGIGINPATEDVVEIFYALLPSGRGRGAATMAVGALSGWALCHGVERVQLLTIVGNVASEAVARRAGFAVEGRETRPQRGQDVEMLRWVRYAHEPQAQE